MKEVRYMISDAAKKINVEPHVLRYWEEELGTEIPRNEMGHRYYREEDIQMMRGVKYLKEKGFQLKSIKILLPEADKVMQLPQRRLLELRDRLELAVSQEELRLQREEELKKCSGALKDYELENPQDGEDLKDCARGGDLSCGGAAKDCACEDLKVAGSREDCGENAQTCDGRTPEACDSRADEAKAAGRGQKETSQERGTSIKKEINVREKKDSNKRTAGENKENISVKEGQARHVTVRVIGGTREKASGGKNELQSSVTENTPSVQASENAERMRQFKSIMNEIIMDAMRENNKELTGSITASVSREVEYHMRKREMMQEEHFKQLDRTLREYQLGQKQAAVAKECGGRRESKFFKKNGKVRI